MGKRGKQLAFNEFGQRFIQYAVTPEVIRASLAQIVPEEQDLIITSPTTVRIRARTVIEDIIPLPYDPAHDELLFEVPLAIHLVLGVNMLVGQEQYTALATTRLRLAARIYAPLRLMIDCAPVEPGQVAVTSEGQDNWFDLAKRFGLLDSSIRQQVADVTNQHIQRSQRQRSIDLRKLIAEFVEGMHGATRSDGTARARRQAPGRGRSPFVPAEALPERAA